MLLIAYIMFLYKTYFYDSGLGTSAVDIRFLEAKGDLTEARRSNYPVTAAPISKSKAAREAAIRLVLPAGCIDALLPDYCLHYRL